jgi:hypothetical protein
MQWKGQRSRLMHNPMVRKVVCGNGEGGGDILVIMVGDLWSLSKVMEERV